MGVSQRAPVLGLVNIETDTKIADVSVEDWDIDDHSIYFLATSAWKWSPKGGLT